MQLGEVIRKYRKMKNMTQEEMACRLGVSAPAVNKWENGNSCPDIALLSPIARLLGISLDTLLSFHDELTADEIGEIVYEADSILKEKTYEEAFQWAKKKLEEYPNCEQLIWQIAVIFDAQCELQEIPNADEYDNYFGTLYIRLLESSDENIRNSAANSLFRFYMRKKKYDKAEKCLEYLSKQNPERKMKQAEIYSVTNRIQEAYKAYEELLFAYYQMISVVFHAMYMLALRGKDMKKAHMFVDKQTEAAKCFEMGKYHEVSCVLEIATIEKDAETVLALMKEMLSSVGEICSYCKSPLYEHMEFKEVREEFLTDLKNNLLKCFRDEESYGFLKDDNRWKQLVSDKGCQADEWKDNFPQIHEEAALFKSVEKIKLYIKELFKGESSGHDYWHSIRVYNNACRIALTEKCDWKIVALASLLHDADDRKLFSTNDYQNARAAMAECGFDEEVQTAVIDVIATVSFNGKDTKIPETVEGKIVQDADRLDAIGAVGIARTFAYGGNHGRRIHEPDELPENDLSGEEYRTHEGTTINHFYEKLFLLKDMMNTESARKIAESRDTFMRIFLDEFLKEWDGEK